ncbi:unnamed protein product [Absidia cylindrospora]
MPLNLDAHTDHSSALVSLGSGNDKLRTSRSQSKRQGELTTVHLALYTNTDISVHAHGRHRYLQTVFNTIPGIAWLDELRLWVFSADQQTYQQVWQLLQKHVGIFDVIGVPMAILRCLPKTTTQLLQEQQVQPHQSSQNYDLQSNDIQGDSLYDMYFDTDDNDDDTYTMAYPKDIDEGGTNNRKMGVDCNIEEQIGQSTLWKRMTMEQQNGVKKGVGMDGHVYLQDPVGSGNSLQALGMVLVHRNNWPVLIICRESVCQKWNVLIQDMLLLEAHQISLLDHVPMHNGKFNYSDSPKAAQSRQQWQRNRENVNEQNEVVTLATAEASTTYGSKKIVQTKGKKTTRKKDDWWIEILENSGDAPLSSISGDDEKVDHVRHTKKKDTLKKKRRLQKDEAYIRLINDSGDYYSDLETADSDDGFIAMDNSTSNKTCKSGTVINHTTKPTMNGTEQSGGNGNNPQRKGATHFFIMSYNKANVKSNLGALSVNEFKMIIFDDCHDLNGTLLPAYKASLQNLVNASRKTIMVSDVPILPRPMESFPLLQILKPSMFDDYKFFGHRYCGAKQSVFGWDYTGNMHE